MNRWMLSAGALALLGTQLLAPPARAQEDPRIEQLQRQIEALQRQLDELKGEVENRMPPPPERAPGAPAPVVSGEKRIKLAISGQINRAINVADDGERTKAYFVDNNNSVSRVRFVGTGEVTEDLSLGTQVELGVGPNNSNEVSQDDEDNGDLVDERKVEAWVDSKRFGRLTLGKGDTASNSTAEVDLSSIDVIAYAAVADIAGGLLFREKGSKDLSTVAVNDAFDDFDGLSRQNRVGYNTPPYAGFGFATSVSSDQRYDGAITWAGSGYGLKAAAATALSDPNAENVDFRLDGSFSVLHEASGLNLTVSSGMDKAGEGGNPSNFYVKGGWIADFFRFGQTAFGVDYTISTNNPTPSDEGFSVGGAVVQHVAGYGTELYSQLRVYSLNRNDAPSVDDIVVGTAGARVKF